MSMKMTFCTLCKNAEEIQERWEPKSGDKYHNKVAINPLRPFMIGSDVMDGIIEYPTFDNKDSFWLPRVEDMVKIAMDELKLNEVEVLSEFNEMMIEAVWIDPEATMEVLFLEWLMNLVFNKQVGKNNTWEEIE